MLGSRSGSRIGLALVALLGALLLGSASAEAAVLRGISVLDEFGSRVLREIEYKDTATGQHNDVEYAPGLNPEVSGCAPTPGPSCNSFALAPDDHLFLDHGGSLSSASGFCRRLSANLGECHGPSRKVCEEFSTFCTPFVTIEIGLGVMQDQFRAELFSGVSTGPVDPVFGTTVSSATPEIFRVEVSGGANNDSIRLLDRTDDGSVVGQPGIATDQISCGSGVDTVVTTPATVVAADCEKVQRVS